MSNINEGLPLEHLIKITVLGKKYTLLEAIQLRNELTKEIDLIQKPVIDFLGNVQSDTSPK